MDHTSPREANPDGPRPPRRLDRAGRPLPDYCRVEMHPSGRRVWIHRPGCKYGPKP